MALPNLLYAAGDRISTTLSGSISDSDLSIPLTSVAGLNTTGGAIILDKASSGLREIVYYSSISTNNLIIPSGGRGVAGTSAHAHSSGASANDVGISDNINNTIDSFTAEHNSDGTHVLADIANILYPVGTIYMNKTVATNPGTLFGVGTWVAIEAKYLVGYKSGDADFGTPGGTGGTKTHSHTLASGYALVSIGSGAGNWPEISRRVSAVPSWTSTHGAASNTGATPTNSRTTATDLGGSTDTTSNLVPYQTVYAWERTA